jgi:phage tail tape-measure protein
LKITAVSVADAAKILASTYGRRVTEEQVRQVVEAGDLARADGTFSLIEYVAYLAVEVPRGHAD